MKLNKDLYRRRNQIVMTARTKPSGSIGKITESNFNTEFANLLRTLHTDWDTEDYILAEKTGIISGKPTAKPDILVCHPAGVPVAIETGFNPARTVEKDATNRIGESLVDFIYPIEQAIAVKIPAQLAHTGQGQIKDAIIKSEFDLCVYSLNRDQLNSFHRWPDSGWITGNIGDLADLIELAAISENILDIGLNILEEGISRASSILRGKYEKRSQVLDKIAKTLNQKDSLQTTHMAMAILLNAMTFHKFLYGVEGIKTFEEIWFSRNQSRDNYDKRLLIEHWTYIVEHINYLPIYEIALKILLALDSVICRDILVNLIEASEKLEQLEAKTRHDFFGRMYQRLITDRKFLATFYTLPSSAALLAEMATDRLKVDWSKSKEIESLKVADFACGTGALLNAAMHSMLTRHSRAQGNQSRIHKSIVEDVIIGTDIMPAATHLTASMIAGVHPENKFNHTSIYTLPYGRSLEANRLREVSLGALDLLDGDPILPIFDTGDRKLATVKGKKSKADVASEIPDNSCDLVIMNPPFTRPTSHEGGKSEIPVPSFAGLERSDTEQKLMSERLKKLSNPDMVGSGHAGLASNFFDIAHRKVKCPNGVIALVLPSTVVQGSSWEKVRQCLETKYTDIVVFSIASSGQSDRAFSADTNMAEVLIIATRKNNGIKQQVKFINLMNRPRSIAEAVIIARKVNREPNASTIKLGDNIVASVFNGDFSSGGFSGVAYPDTALTIHKLTSGELSLPHIKQPISIPIAPLSELGRVGLLDRRIHGKLQKEGGELPGSFDRIAPPVSKNPTYPMLWAHNALAETKLVVEPDSEGRVRPNCDEDASFVWNETKSRLHFNRDFRLNSQPLAACITEKESIGGRAWPNYVLLNAEWEIPIVLWANTTIGLMSFWWKGGRQQLGRAILTNTQLQNLLTLDASKLSQSQFNQSVKIFDSFKVKELLPANEAWNDPNRHDLDHAILVELLGIDKKLVEKNLDLLRNQWCEEPSVHGGKTTAPS